MKTRPAEPADLEAIVEIHNQAVDSAATGRLDRLTVEGRREWLRERARDRPILVADLDGKVVGWSEIGDYRPGRRGLRHTAEISYFVHSDHRRKGVASALVRRCIDLCPSLGVRTLLAIVLDDNLATAGLLGKLGFEEWGRMPGAADIEGREIDHVYYGRRVS